jgi:hypothetical protein
VKKHNEDGIISSVTEETIISNPNKEALYGDKEELMVLCEIQTQDSSDSELTNPLD